MRLRVGLILVGLLLATLGAVAARASAGDTTTTTDTTTTSTTMTTTTTTTPTTTTTTTSTTTTTTATTTTTSAPSYSPLPRSLLSTACVGAGIAAIAAPSQSVVMVGAPAYSRGPSGYPDSGSVLAFNSSVVTGSGCTHRRLALSSVSLFGGAVRASGVVATGGKGTVAGLEIGGAPVSATAGQTVAVADWGQLTLGARFGRLTAPLVLRLLREHGSFAAGTQIAVAFAAAPLATHGGTKLDAAARKHRHGNHAGAKRRTKRRPPPDFPVTPDPFLFGGLLAPALQTNAVVSIAMQYLGIRYTWGGARPVTGFDCSGLVKYVFAQLGVSLPHYAASQFYLPDAVSVAPNELRAGDLVFFTGSDGTRKMPGHVGIYISDGYFIDAPHTGAFVEIDNLAGRWFANNYVGARRIVGVARSRRLAASKGTSPSFVDAVSPFFLHPLTLNAMGAVPTAAAFPAAERDASHVGAIWGGSALAGLLLFVCSGTFALRRRRPPNTEPSDSPPGI